MFKLFKKYISFCNAKKLQLYQNSHKSLFTGQFIIVKKLYA